MVRPESDCTSTVFARAKDGSPSSSKAVQARRYSFTTVSKTFGFLVVDLANTSATSRKPLRHAAACSCRAIPKRLQRVAGRGFRTAKRNELRFTSPCTGSAHLDAPAPDRSRLLGPLLLYLMNQRTAERPGSSCRAAVFATARNLWNPREEFPWKRREPRPSLDHQVRSAPR